MKRTKAILSVLMAGIILQGSVVGAVSDTGLPKSVVESRAERVYTLQEGISEIFTATINRRQGQITADRVEVPGTLTTLALTDIEGLKVFRSPDTLAGLSVTENADLEEVYVGNGKVYGMENNPNIRKIVLERGVFYTGSLIREKDARKLIEEGRVVDIYISSTVTELPNMLVVCNLMESVRVHTPKGSPAYEKYKDIGNGVVVVPESSPIWGESTALEKREIYEKQSDMGEVVEARRLRTGKMAFEKRSAPENVEGVLNRTKVYVDGKEVSMRSYLINGNNYVPIREFADKVKDGKKPVDVLWDKEREVIDIITGTRYTGYQLGLKGPGADDAKSGRKTNSPITVDKYSVDMLGYNIENNNHFKLRDIGNVLDIQVEWDEETKSVHIKTNEGYVEQEK